MRTTANGVPMVESQSLKLVFSASRVHEQITEFLSRSLQAKGYESATASALDFLGALECGVNYGSEIARNLGVSRQMVAKTVKQLCQVGYLQQTDGVGKQKQILFTELGEHLMSDARILLAQLDELLLSSTGAESLEGLVNELDNIHAQLINIE